MIEVEADEGRILVESARPVTVIDTRQAGERTADLGEVLSRAQGIQVRRTGGLGSSTRFSLNGLYDEQIRFFLDGIPLDMVGFGLAGVAAVPVQLVKRIEVHRGVVPVALGADALGGAVDLVTDTSWSDHAAASWQFGSFGTHRASALARGRHDSTGLVGGLTLFVDRATNDYPIDVQVADSSGRLHPATVRRFHDGYLARGGIAELGVVDRGALRRALVRVYGTDSDKELQHNAVMTVPYGEASYGELVGGATADVVVSGDLWSARLLAGGARRRVDFTDVADVVYNWFGEAIRERMQPGELGTEPTDQRITESGYFARATGELDLGAHHRIRIAVAPTATSRDGRDYLEPNPDGRDPLSARRDLVQLVSGVEHELHLGEDRLENVAFAKYYGLWTDAEDLRPGFIFVPISSSQHRFGVGDAARLRVLPWLMVKGSYEWATRLPSVDETFGDGILVRPNLALAPETSHNANLGAHVQTDTRLGGLGGEVNFFARLADRLIILLGDDRYFTYQNVWAGRILGVEGTAGWVAPGEWASIEGSLTFQDIRNASSEGTFGAFDGDRIPNRPWLFGSLSGTGRIRDLVLPRDELSLFGSSRYVHQFYRGWESLGRRDYKQVVAGQVVHSAGVTYAVRDDASYAATLEVQNLTDAEAFDSFGVQKPGRSVFMKISGEL